MKKYWIIGYIIALIMIPILCQGVIAETSGTCGDNLTWVLDDDGVLTISGNGSMGGYLIFAPWYDNRTDITQVVLNNGVTSIGRYAFYGCSDLTSVNIPDGVTSIGDDAFQDCNNLTSINIPDGVTSIGDGVFRGCSNLTSISIPDGVTSIGELTFYNCSNLTSINIPDGVNIIGDYAFGGCSSLTSINIPDTVTSIGNSVFWACDAIKYAQLDTIGAKALSKGGYTFRIPETNYSLKYLYAENEITGLEISSVDKDVISFSIPDIVTSIGDDAFQDCNNLTSINIPDGVTSIGDDAFQDCNNLTSINIPDGVASIGDDAFRGCYNLTSINLPDSIISIGNRAFYSCESLTSITIPKEVTSIGPYTFALCSGLTMVSLPKNITKIDNGAFSNCESFKLYIPSAEEVVIHDDAFRYCSPTVYCYEYTPIEAWAISKGFRVFLLDNALPEEFIIIELPSSVSVGLGQQTHLSVTLFPDLAEYEKTWASADPDIATVDENGVVTGISSGTADITLSYGGKQATCQVTVQQHVEDFELEDVWLVAKTSVVGLRYLTDLVPASGVMQLTWTTGNSTYATVDNTGYITAGAVGETTLTVTDAYSGITRTSTIYSCYPVTAIDLELSDASVYAGFPANVTANVTMRTQTCVNHLVTFSTSDETIATIDAQGNITTLQPGTVTITATADSGITASCDLVVNAIQRILSLPAQLTMIESEAFSGLSAVEAVRIPATVQSIADDAFSGSNIIVLAPAGSYAIQWAADHEVRYIAE